jgi:hypothetical protein
MSATLKHITQRIPTEVPVLTGAAEELVRHRELRNKYETNRSIKTWSCWFLLKALTTSGKIQRWRSQRDFLFEWLQLNENTFYARLHEMERLEIITIDDKDSIHLVSYDKAAEVLGIAYNGLTHIQYNPNDYAGKQVFQYFLRAEEFRSQQVRQLNALHYHLDKNPLLKSDLHLLLIKYGADGQQLHRSASYFQERLLKLQMLLFKEGSDILQYVLTRRADINRGNGRIMKDHSYKSKQSVTYLKHRMKKLGVVVIEKRKTESVSRSRHYFTGEDGKKKEGYKYCRKSKKTVMFLTDQISFAYEAKSKRTGEGQSRRVA